MSIIITVGLALAPIAMQSCLVVYDISLSLSLSRSLPLSLFLEDLDAQIAMRQCFFGSIFVM
jgi:hypothetical protein